MSDFPASWKGCRWPQPTIQPYQPDEGWDGKNLANQSMVVELVPLTGGAW